MMSDEQQKSAHRRPKHTPQLNFDHEHKVMKMFCDNAKTYIQLSGTALGLTITFREKILGEREGSPPGTWMIVMWLCFMVAICAGAFYQYLAVKYLEREIDWDYYEGWQWLPPGTIYAVMLLAFYGGTVTFTAYSIIRLL
jgi:hypothetical protein